MATSNYPNGFLNGVTIRGVPITQLHPGKVFWVNNSSVLAEGGSAGSNGNPGTYKQPFSTLDYAVGRCTASRGDIIAIMPGHAETYSTATATADDLELDVAGVAIIGLGNGSLRPKFTFDTANTVNVAVSAANITIVNCNFVANFLSNAIMFLLTTAKHFSLIRNRFSDTSAALNTVNIVESTGAANTIDGLYCEGNRAHMLGTTFNCFAVTAAGQDEITFIDNIVYSIDTADAPGLLDIGGVVTDLFMTGNHVSVNGTTNAQVIFKCTGTTSTGFFSDNRAYSLDTTGDSFTVTSNIVAAQNAHTGAIGAQGFMGDPPLDT